jgi:hypothetical protein
LLVACSIYLVIVSILKPTFVLNPCVCGVFFLQSSGLCWCDCLFCWPGYVLFSNCTTTKLSKHYGCHTWNRNCLPSGAHEFTPGFSGDCVARSLVFCALFCKSWFALSSLLLALYYCVLSIYSFNFLFGILKLFLLGSRCF